jgi:peptidoglycan/xylan/chitin deacetylase (PgdA/CDA1 family)
VTPQAGSRDSRTPWPRLLRGLRQRRSVILGYHGIGECDLRLDLSRLQVSPQQFRRHVHLLADAGFRFMTVSQAADALTARPPEPGIAVVTFDDGLANNLTTALPILQEIGAPATVYVACDFIGGHSPWIGRGGGGEMLDNTGIRALAQAGWEVGAHTLSHPDMSLLTYDRCRAEVDGSRRVLEEVTGSPVDTFAYPFGRYGEAAVAAVADSGMRAAVTTGSGHWRRFELTRAMCSTGDPYPLVVLKMLDLYEPVLRLPPVRALRTASKRLRLRLGEG